MSQLTGRGVGVDLVGTKDQIFRQIQFEGSPNDAADPEEGSDALASKVWKYYGDNLDDEFSHCLLCKYHPTRGGEVHIKVNNGSNTAMRNHLKSHHQK